MDAELALSLDGSAFTVRADEVSVPRVIPPAPQELKQMTEMAEKEKDVEGAAREQYGGEWRVDPGQAEF